MHGQRILVIKYVFLRFVKSFVIRIVRYKSLNINNNKTDGKSGDRNETLDDIVKKVRCNFSLDWFKVISQQRVQVFFYKCICPSYTIVWIIIVYVNHCLAL